MLAYGGSFVGTGVAGNAITGIGFQPDIVLNKVGGTGIADTWFRTKDMAANISVPVRSDLGGATNRITSLDADGFTVGSDNIANQSGSTYNFLALKDNGLGDFSTVTYVGDVTDDKLVFTGFQPDYALLKSNTTIVGAQKFSGQSSALATPASNIASMQFQSGADRADLMAFLPGGLYVSNGSSSGGNLVNMNTFDHYGFAVKNVTGFTATGSYTGTGVAGNTITTGFPPIFISIHAATAQVPVIHWANQAGNISQAWDSAEATTRLAGVSSTGFTVAASDAATNSSGITYWWMAIGANSGVISPSLYMPYISPFLS